ncbi:MAG: T9SS type A sorting domain-containing protein [Crocinitomicaceae bacterium]|nr:T9SS type A sorting domain-containing protein [Crocinitomicaceae bacterium]MBT5402011.1 T9SS type A sorting domain-containing protein [Crocinitomicaceae bacterium]MBT6514350.1 T9SS type A sorting domain-containing protein [Crocinitomicaceae bacterium]
MLLKAAFLAFTINFISFHQLVFGQCTGALWSEDFSYTDGTTIGANNNTVNPAFDWTSGGCTTCDGASDTWDVRNNKFQAHDVNDHESWLLTESINIVGFSTIDFCVTISEIGDHEGLYMSADDCNDVSNQDYVDVEYQVDGAGWTLVQNYLGWCGLYNSCANHTFFGDDGATQGDCRNSDVDWGSSNLTITGLSGSTLEIRITVRNSAGSEYITIDNITVQGNTPLPVELVSFKAEVKTENVLLSWTSASETNNAFYWIERSQNGSDFKELAVVTGSGTTQSSSDYQFTDFNPISPVSFYRLKQTDFDGAFQYSHPRRVTLEQDERLRIRQVYQNQNQLQVILNQKPKSIYRLRLIGLSGQVILDKTEQKQEVIFPIKPLAPGFYCVSLINASVNETIKFFVH